MNSLNNSEKQFKKWDWCCKNLFPNEDESFNNLMNNSDNYIKDVLSGSDCPFDLNETLLFLRDVQENGV